MLTLRRFLIADRISTLYLSLFLFDFWIIQQTKWLTLLKARSRSNKVCRTMDTVGVAHLGLIPM